VFAEESSASILPLQNVKALWAEGTLPCKLVEGSSLKAGWKSTANESNVKY